MAKSQAGPVTQLLIKARLRITDVARWSRGSFARDVLGNPVVVNSEQAVCWCAVGSLEREAGATMPDWLTPKKVGAPVKVSHKEYHRANTLLQVAAKEINGGVAASATVINDGMGHGAAMRMYNRAIVLTKGE